VLPVSGDLRYEWETHLTIALLLGLFPAVPVLAIGVIALGAIALANVVAAIPARIAARTPEALLLRTV